MLDPHQVSGLFPQSARKKDNDTEYEVLYTGYFFPKGGELSQPRNRRQHPVCIRLSVVISSGPASGLSILAFQSGVLFDGAVCTPSPLFSGKPPLSFRHFHADQVVVLSSDLAGRRE